MKPVASEISLFFRRARRQVTGILASHVDDTLVCGDNSFSEITKKTREKFEVKSREYDKMRFSGVYIDKIHDGYEIHQWAYIDRLKKLLRDAAFTRLRRSRAQLSWLVHSRPDICVTASKLAQVTEKTFERKHVNRFNTAVTYLVESRDLSLQMRKLDMGSLHVRAYADASFATNHNFTSQLGYIVLLCDKYDNASKLHYASYKSRRVARSVLGAETYAFADAYDFAYCAKRDLENILGRRVPLEMYTDSKGLFDVITKWSQRQERRLMIDLQAVRDAYNSHEISNVGFIRGPNNPAEGMTKPLKYDPLNRLLRTGRADFTVDQWVIRSFNSNLESDCTEIPSNSDHQQSTDRPVNHNQMISARTQDGCYDQCNIYYSSIALHHDLCNVHYEHNIVQSSMHQAIKSESVYRQAVAITRS